MIVEVEKDGVTSIGVINNQTIFYKKMIISENMNPEQIVLGYESVNKNFVIFGYLKINFKTEKEAIALFNKISLVFN